MASDVSSVYIKVVEDVINKVRDDFIKSGSGENTLNELQMWENKMLLTGAISGDLTRSSDYKKARVPTTPADHPNVPYHGPMKVENETPTAEMPFSPTWIQTLLSETGPGMYTMLTGHSDYVPSPKADIRNSMEMEAGMFTHCMEPPSPWMNQRPFGMDVNVACNGGREEAAGGSSHQAMTQFQELTAEDYNAPRDRVELRATVPSVGISKPDKNERGEDDEPPLNEDDDDVDDDNALEEPTQHSVLSLFEKVHRTKSRWRCTLKAGIMHLNNRDILFNKASGEFDFDIPVKGKHL